MQIIFKKFDTFKFYIYGQGKYVVLKENKKNDMQMKQFI